MAVTHRFIEYLLDGFKVVIEHERCGPVGISLILGDVLQ